MGQVFEARDRELGRTVALKFLMRRGEAASVELLARLRKEAQAIALLDHENIVRIHDVSEWRTGTAGQEGRELRRLPFLVMEYLEGTSLQELLRRERPDLVRALGLMVDVSAGLAHAHQRGLVHRDLKPGNVLVLKDGRAKLLDFGLARAAEDLLLEPEGASAGTPAYMAPEQWRGEPLDARTDVWAAGILLFELLTGARPLTCMSARELGQRVCSAEPMPSVSGRRPGLPEALVHLVDSALAKDPAKRPAHGGELLARLREVLEQRARDVSADPPPHLSGRRLVTLVSCRLALAPGEAAALEPEDCGELERAFHQSCTRIVQQHEGTVLLSVGGEVLACFGVLAAREDDAERAVRAALRLKGACPQQLKGPGTARGTVKVGLHTDRVVMAEAPLAHPGAAPSLHGEGPRVASWLSGQARPGGVLASEGTHALVRGRIQTRPLGRLRFEGLVGTTWLGVHEVMRERHDASRFDRALVSGALTPLVGREQLLGGLKALREEALRGSGACALLRGEAGIGKSRLVRELHDREPPGTSTWVRCQCWLSDTGSAFHPLIGQLQHLLGFCSAALPTVRVQVLEGRLLALGVSLDLLPPLASLLGLPVPAGAVFLHLPPERQRASVLEALVAFLRAEAERKPLVLVVEDLHWADPSTLQFLGILLEQLGRIRALVLLTARPGFHSPWEGLPRFHSLEVEPLSPEDTRAMALLQQDSGGASLPVELVDRLVERTDGMPLFIEELARAVLAGRAVGHDAPEGAPIPMSATLHELLLARLDGLPPRRRAQVQLAAALGREFSYELLRAVSFLGEDELLPELEQLEAAGLFLRQGEPPSTTYAFRHALIQEAAYQSLLRGTRQRYHARIVQVLTEQFPEVVEEQPELLAQHATQAGETWLAVKHWQAAGQRAVAKSAFPEAISHYSRTLEQLALLPSSPEQNECELAVRGDLEQVLIMVQGFTSREVEEVHSRALALCEPAGHVPISLLAGTWNIAIVRGDRQATDRLVTVFRRLLDERCSLDTQVMVHSSLHVWSFWRQDFAMGCEHGLRAKALLARPEARSLLMEARGGHRDYASMEALYTCLWLGIGEMVQGQGARSRAHYAEALALAESMGHPYPVASALGFGAMMSFEAGEPQATLEASGRSMSLGSELGFSFVVAVGSFMHGWALAQLGQAREGIAMVREGLAGLRGSGALLLLKPCLLALSQACLAAGRLDDALAATHEALEALEGNLARYPMATLLQVRAEVLLRRGEVEAARTAFHQSLAVARESGAKLHELRAALGLAGLLLRVGEAHAVRPLLEGLCDGLSEGQDLKDYQRARHLLAELP
jgi:class 3 adenylate cyclase/tetratricopeptide (TPR) repeat protein